MKEKQEKPRWLFTGFDHKGQVVVQSLFVKIGKRPSLTIQEKIDDDGIKTVDYTKWDKFTVWFWDLDKEAAEHLACGILRIRNCKLELICGELDLGFEKLECWKMRGIRVVFVEPLYLADGDSMFDISNIALQFDFQELKFESFVKK